MRLHNLPLLLLFLLGSAQAAAPAATTAPATLTAPPEGAAQTSAAPDTAAQPPTTPDAATQPAAAPGDATASAPTPPPLGQEERWVNGLRTSAVKSEIRELSVDGKPFLTLYREEKTGKPKGTVILLHDVDGHADWPAVISPLRSGLAAEGWSTLSLQLPIPADVQRSVDYNALIEEGLPRLRTAIADLQQREVKNIVIAGYGLGALAALRYLSGEPEKRNKDEPISGLAIIAIRELTPVIAESDTPKRLAGLQIPILDIYGGRDIYSTVASALERGTTVRKKALELKTPYRYAGPTALAKNVEPYQLAYRQYPIAGADHAFTGQQALVVRTVHGWLDRQTRGPQAK